MGNNEEMVQSAIRLLAGGMLLLCKGEKLVDFALRRKRAWIKGSDDLFWPTLKLGWYRGGTAPELAADCA
jgi:hypothetical protein